MLVPIVIVAAIAIWAINRSAPTPATSNAPASVVTIGATLPGPTAVASPASASVPGPIGGVTGCRKQPPFSEKLGFGKGTALSTAERTVKGLIIVEQSQNNAAPKTYQHPSWVIGGYLGPNGIDRDGNIYVAPAPRVNLIDNPPERANYIYKVDAATGVMTKFLELPFAQAPSLSNPYGVLGLTYDCDTNSLYAASVAGSSRESEVGRIFHIDLNTGKITSEIDNIDAIGLGVFNGAKGKRLYFGTARAQDVRSVVLDATGNFVDQPRVEFSLGNLGPDGNDKARKISFDRNNDMIVNGTKFTFNLAPPAAQIRAAAYRYRYDSAKDSWAFVEAGAGPGAALQ